MSPSSPLSGTAYSEFWGIHDLNCAGLLCNAFWIKGLGVAHGHASGGNCELKAFARAPISATILTEATPRTMKYMHNTTPKMTKISPR
jgi:hypothetical protein